MKTKEEIMEILTKEFPLLKREYGVVKCGLFGSYSRDQIREGSDVLHYWGFKC